MSSAIPSGTPEFSKGPPGPYPQGGITATPGMDEVAYILKPGVDFHRPWLYTPGGTVYVWPAGIEGFQITSNATTGIHHYIGSNGVTVNVVYPDELHVVLTGNFPGKTSVENMLNLRAVILQQSTQQRKVLALPGIITNLVYVAVINHQFNHDVGDGSYNITYSIEVIKVGFGGPLTTPPLQLPQSNPVMTTQPMGKGQQSYQVKAGNQTLRGIAYAIYGAATQTNMQKLINNNRNVLSSLSIPSYKWTTAPLPVGTELGY